jgi:hypothetical protein
MTTVDALSNPQLAVLKAAELDIMICDARALAARYRRSCIAYELAGNPIEAAAWADRAETQAEQARELDRQRAQLVARYCPPSMTLADDDRGVCA